MINDDGSSNKLYMFQGFTSVKVSDALKKKKPTWIQAADRRSNI